jgi:hypothetical protein
MVEAEELVNEQIATLRTYIQLLEKIERVFWGFRLSRMERTVMEAIDRKVGLAVQLLAVASGLGMVIVGLGVGRLVVRSPLMLLGVVVVSGLIGIGLVVLIFHRARRQIAENEIRIAQLKIYQLEAQQPLK